MSTKPPTLKQFQKRFPDDDVCLEHIMRVRYGQRFACESCGREAHFYRVKGRRCYECEHCGYQVYPTAGTPFEKTRTPLTDWFFVMFLFTASRNGVAAKEVQRQIGVTYKTAWRMCKEIRTYMGTVDGDRPLGGARPFSPVVEIDKAFRRQGPPRTRRQGRCARNGGASRRCCHPDCCRSPWSPRHAAGIDLGH